MATKSDDSRCSGDTESSERWVCKRNIPLYISPMAALMHNLGAFGPEEMSWIGGLFALSLERFGWLKEQEIVFKEGIYARR